MIHGLTQSLKVMENTELTLDTPNICAEKLMTHKADIGLVPVGALLDMDYYQIISDCCIGAFGNVRTVVLASNVPIEQIETIVLDPFSRTSNLLLQILAKEFWKKDFHFYKGMPEFENKDIKNTTAAVVIGDKVFSIEKKYTYIIDLSNEWLKFTGLPFVFAVWAATSDIDIEYISDFNQAVMQGARAVDDAIDNYPQQINISREEKASYLHHNIDFDFDEKKKTALSLFHQMAKEIKA